MARKAGTTTPAERAKVFHSLVVRHKLRAAIRYISDRDKGRVYYPNNMDEKSGDLVIAVLKGKHPRQRDTPVADVFRYKELCTLLDVTLGEDTVGLVAKNLSGSAGP